MNVIKRTSAMILYVLVSLSVLIFVSIKYWIPLSLNDYSTILIYLFLLILVNSYPLKIGEIYVTFIMAVSITVFLEYGLVVEVWLTQIAILVSMLVSDQKRPIRRIILSQMMFVWNSIAAGASYLLLGGTIGFKISTFSDQIIPILFYTLTYFIVNHIFLFLILRVMENIKFPLFSEDSIWDAATFLITLPFGLLMYILKATYGNYGMIFVALIIIIVTHLFRIYTELHQSNKRLMTLNKITTSFTSELNLEKTISALQQAIRELLTFNHSYIFLVNGDKLKLISGEDINGQVIDFDPLKDFNLSFGEGLTGRVALSKKAQIVERDADIFRLDYGPDFIKNNRSLLSVPMIWHNQIIGVITLGSLNEYHFSKKDMTIAKILASQAGIAIQNASTYKKTEEKSLIDELTGLYNFRAFEDMLLNMVQEAEMREENISLLIIDLDHFKKVNDRYGHSAGNDVLKSIANLLKEFTRQEDVVARYGGEEYAVIIPNSDSDKAKAIAERIRFAIENHVINVADSIEEIKETMIQVTASIGVASFPKMASSEKDLIRNADRAMYIGSKQAGRNKVSVYDSK